MDRLEFTLLCDGSSDAILLHPLTWLLEQHLDIPIDGTWADLRLLPHPPKDLPTRIDIAVRYYPCDLLFVHRDAEREPYDSRVAEICSAVAKSERAMVPVVPVRMQEAWLLTDEKAIREAADNPNGKTPLALPPLNRLEKLPDPKAELHNLLRAASEYKGRRLKRFNPGKKALRLGEILTDFHYLRQLPAFRRTEEQTVDVLKTLFPNAHTYPDFRG